MNASGLFVGVALAAAFAISEGGAFSRETEHKSNATGNFLVLVGDERNKIVLVKDDETVELVNRLDFADNFAYSFHDNLLFYLDIRQRIRSANIADPKAPHKVVLGINSNMAIACLSVDWITKKVYWISENNHHFDPVKSRIGVTDFEGSYWAALVSTPDDSKSLIVDPLHGYMYWINTQGYGDGVVIHRARLDGTDQRKIVNDRSVRPCTTGEIALDFKQNVVYWCEYNVGSAEEHNGPCRLMRARTDGSRREQVASFPPENMFYYFLVYNDYIYWHEFMKEGVMRCSKHFGRCKSSVQHLYPNYLHWNYFLPYEADYQLQSPVIKSGGSVTNNECAVNNGGCSHFCFLTPDAKGRSCGCPTGIRSISETQCAAGYEKVLFVATRTSIGYVSLDVEEPIQIKIPLKDEILHAVAIDYDPIENFIYWTDQDHKKIRRAKMDRTGVGDVVSSELDRPEGIAVDWLSRNIYWTDAGTGRIEVARMDGKARRVLISDKLREPRAIVLDPVRGYMYWSDWHSHDALEPKIERASLDGSNRTVLVDFVKRPSTSPTPSWPNGLALNTDKQLLYWIDGKNHKLEVVSSKDGSTRRQIDVKVSKPQALTLIGDKLYWSEDYGRKIGHVNIDGTDEAYFPQEVADIKGVKAATLNSSPSGSNPCGLRNNGCAHLCLHRPTGPVCACTLGYELGPDGQSCTEPSAFMVFVHNGQKDVMRISMSNNPSNLDSLKLSTARQPSCVDFDWKQQKLFWAGGENGDSSALISFAYFNGTGKQTIVDVGRNRFVEDMAVDWLAGQVYWTVTGPNQIEVARTDGRSRRVLVWTRGQPRSIAVDPANGVLYWTDIQLGSNEQYAIRRSNLDGSDIQNFQLLEARPVALSLDYDLNRVYWLAQDKTGMTFLQFMEAEDTAVHTVLRTKKGSGWNSLGVLRNKLFISDTMHNEILQLDSTCMQCKEIDETHSCKECKMQDANVLHRNITQIIDLRVVDALKQKGWNKCTIDNGGCKGLCFALPDALGQLESRCGCPTHFNWQDGHCKAPGNYLLLVRDGEVLRLSLDRDPIEPFVTLIGPRLTAPVSLQYDPMEHYLYWIDDVDDEFDGLYYPIHRGHNTDKRVSRVMKRARIDPNDLTYVVETMGSEDRGRDRATPLLSKECQPQSLALEVYGRTLYVACEHANTLEAIRLDEGGQLRPLGELIPRTEGMTPRWVAVAPGGRSVYFVDATGDIRVMKYSLGLGNVTKLTRVGGGATASDVRVTVVTCSRCAPSQRERVYFTDGGALYAINGAKRLLLGWKTERHLTGGDTMMASYGQQLLLIGVDKRSLLRFGPAPNATAEYTSLPNFALPEALEGVSAIVSVNVSMETYVRSNPCVLHDRCSHMCWLSHGGHQPVDRLHAHISTHSCSCPAGLSLVTADGSTCKEREACPNALGCDNGRECYRVLHRCDGVKQCSDGSDEARCHASTASALHALCMANNGLWQCIDGSKCIKISEVCDSVHDCKDSSDEKYCPCTNGQTNMFECTWSLNQGAKAPECIDRRLVCDGKYDCESPYHAADENPLFCPITRPSSKTPPHSKDDGGEVTLALYVVIGVFVAVLVIICFVFVLVYTWRKQRPAHSQPDENPMTCRIPPTNNHMTVNVYNNPDGGEIDLTHETFLPPVSSIGPSASQAGVGRRPVDPSGQSSSSVGDRTMSSTAVPPAPPNSLVDSDSSMYLPIHRTRFQLRSDASASRSRSRPSRSSSTKKMHTARLGYGEPPPSYSKATRRKDDDYAYSSEDDQPELAYQPASQCSTLVEDGDSEPRAPPSSVAPSVAGSSDVMPAPPPSLSGHSRSRSHRKRGGVPSHTSTNSSSSSPNDDSQTASERVRLLNDYDYENLLPPVNPPPSPDNGSSSQSYDEH